MNTAAHLHLMLNHVPVIGTLVAVLILLFAYLKAEPVLLRTGLWMLVALAFVSVAVMWTGEPAEELLDGVAGVSPDLIERHEGAAEVATLLLGAIGVVAAGALASLSRFRAANGRIAFWILLFALVPAVAMGYVAWLGGKIRHTECRSDQSGIASWSHP